jgi:hypothetical protein
LKVCPETDLGRISAEIFLNVCFYSKGKKKKKKKKEKGKKQARLAVIPAGISKPLQTPKNCIFSPIF